MNGYDLKNVVCKNLDSKSNKILASVKEKIKNSSWVNFNYLCRRNEIDKKIIKCITFSHYFADKKKFVNLIESADVSDLKMFD